MAMQADSPFTGCRVRVNVTHDARLIGLVEEGAVVELSVAMPLDRQTTLTIETPDGETTYLSAVVVRSFVRTGAPSGRPEHYLALEFLDASLGAAAVRRMMAGMPPAPRQLRPPPRPAGTTSRTTSAIAPA